MPLLKRDFGMVLVGTVLLGAPGCQTSCTEVGCESGVGLQVVGGDGAVLADGVYEVTIVADGLETSCTVSVTGESAQLSANNPCVGDLPVRADGISGQVDLFVNDLVYSVEVEVSRDGDTLGTEVFERTPLDVTEFSPNGEDCGPTCRRWGATMVVQDGG